MAAFFETYASEIVVGIIGSIVGAAIIGLFTFGVSFTKSQRKIRRSEFSIEISEYNAANKPERDRIAFRYFFDAFKWTLIASVIASIISMLNSVLFLSGLSILWGPVGTITAIIMLIANYKALSILLRLQRVRSEVET